MIDNSIKTSAENVLSHLRERRNPAGSGAAFESLINAMSGQTKSREPQTRQEHNTATQNKKSLHNHETRQTEPTHRTLHTSQTRPGAGSKLNNPESAHTEKPAKTQPVKQTNHDSTTKTATNKTNSKETSKTNENTAPTQQADTPESQQNTKQNETTSENSETITQTLPAQTATGTENNPTAPNTNEPIDGSELIENLKHAQGKTVAPARNSGDTNETGTLNTANTTTETEEPATTLPKPDQQATPQPPVTETEKTAAQISEITSLQTGAPNTTGNTTRITNTAEPVTNPAVTAANNTSGTNSYTALHGAETPAPATSPAPPAISQTTTVHAPNLSQQLFDQMQASLHRLKALGQGDHQLKLAINPETFGPVRLAAHFHADGTVSLQLLAASEAAKEQIRQILSDLRRDLAATGLDGQLDLAQNDQEFARFAGETGGEETRGEQHNTATRHLGESEIQTEDEPGYIPPTVGTVLKDGSDGSVDRFA